MPSSPSSLSRSEDLLKIPQTILEAVQPVQKGKRTQSGNTSTQTARKSLLDLPNEILFNIFSCITWKPPVPGWIFIDECASTCFALTCKRLAEIAIMRCIENPVRQDGFVGPDFDTGKFMNMLASGWNRNGEFRLCQLSQRFARNTFWPDSRHPHFKSSDEELLHGLEKSIQTDKPLCRPCLRTKAQVLKRVRTRVQDYIVWDEHKFSIDKKLDEIDHAAYWKQALNDVALSEEQQGRKVYINREDRIRCLGA